MLVLLYVVVILYFHYFFSLIAVSPVLDCYKEKGGNLAGNIHLHVQYYTSASSYDLLLFVVVVTLCARKSSCYFVNMCLMA